MFRPIRRFGKQQGWKVRLVHAPGHPAETIAAMAETESFDRVVMGAQGHPALVDAALGSVATGVLSRCKTPLLLIR